MNADNQPATNGLRFCFADADLVALASGALWWPVQSVLCVADMHLGKSRRYSRQGGAALPPYEVGETLSRLDADIAGCNPKTVICLGDNFDDIAAAGELGQYEVQWLNRLMAGRDWIWIAGNHDPAPMSLGGTHLAELSCQPLRFRHIAQPGAQGEVSGHYHPKLRLGARGRSLSYRCFLVDDSRLILPAYGTYTGGLRSNDQALQSLMAPGAEAIVLMSPPRRVPLPRTPVV